MFNVSSSWKSSDELCVNILVSVLSGNKSINWFPWGKLIPINVFHDRVNELKKEHGDDPETLDYLLDDPDQYEFFVPDHSRYGHS